MRALIRLTLQLRDSSPDDRERIEQHERLIEDASAIGIAIASHAPVALRVQPEESPVVIGYEMAGVSREVADAGD